MLNFDRLQRHLANPLTLTPNARAGGSGMPAYSRKGKGVVRVDGSFASTHNTPDNRQS